MPESSQGVWTVNVPQAWLDANGELPLCIAQPAIPSGAEIQNDQSRPEAVLLARAVFAVHDGLPQLVRWLPGDAGLLVFPEFAFGSPDFEILQELVHSYPRRLIVLAGFGPVRGSQVLASEDRCALTWSEQISPIEPDARYNAGWCFIHEPGNTRCHVFLKNLLDPRTELALIPGLATGSRILRIQTADLALFPLICADLISEQQNSPRIRIEQSLLAAGGGRVLIVGLMYTPIHEIWHAAINQLVQLADRSAGLCTVNQIASLSNPDPSKDKWGSFSGGFIHKQIMSKGPSPVLPVVRYVDTNNASGLILRRTCVGIAAGRFRWVNDPQQGRYMWVPEFRREFDGTTFKPVEESAPAQELRRYLLRERDDIIGQFHGNTHSKLRDGLNRIVAEPNEKLLSPRLWQRLLKGLDTKGAVFDDDALDKFKMHLDSALAGIAAIEEYVGATAIEGGPVGGQLRLNSEIFVWNSPKLSWQRLVQSLRTSALEHPGEPPIVVVAKSMHGHGPAQEIRINRQTDITVAQSEGRNITLSRARAIQLRLLVEIENALHEDGISEEQREAAIRAVVAMP